MNEKFLNKYRVSSTRATWWDYGNNAPYFITICTEGRKDFFGEIYVNHIRLQNEMHLSKIGKIVQTEWLKTPVIRPDMKISLDAWVVMPNHFHGIIVIGSNEHNCRDAMHGVSINTTTMHNQFGPQRKNLASVMRGFKSGVTVQSRPIHSGFVRRDFTGMAALLVVKKRRLGNLRTRK